MESDITNVLGVLIAFVTLILLFSIVVTSLVQATQAIIRLRARNLWRGVTRILKEVGAEKASASDEAFEVLNQSSSGVMAILQDPSSLVKKVVGPQVSWLTPDQLEEALLKAKVSSDKAEAAAIKLKQSEAPQSKRFQFWTRMLAILWAIVVAFYFQLSTPEILTHLGSSPEARAELQRIGKDAAVSKNAPTDTSSIYTFQPGRDPGFLKDDHAAADLVGLALTVILLTLGAPFWFNLLKNLVSLKDALGEEKKEEEGPPMLDQKIEKLELKVAGTTDPIRRVELQNTLDDMRLIKAKLPSS